MSSRRAGTPPDTQTDFVRHLLGFIGITDVELVYAEGLTMGEENKAAVLASARVGLTRLAARASIAVLRQIVVAWVPDAGHR